MRDTRHRFHCLFTLALAGSAWCLAWGLSGTSAYAISTTWSGNTSNVWSTSAGGNWSAGYSDGDDVTFNNTGANTAISISGTVDPGSITFDNSIAYSLSGGVITGASDIIKNGSGITTLSSTNSITGKAFLNGGAISINADARLGTAPGSPVADQITFNGGTLTAANAFTFSANRGWTMSAGGGTFNADHAGTNVFAGSITGAGTLIKQGTGELELQGDNTGWTGLLDIQQGRIDLRVTATGLGSSATGVEMANGTELFFNAGGNFTWDDDILSNGGELRNTISSNNNLDGTITANSNTTTIANYSTSGGVFAIRGDVTGSGDVMFTSGGNFRPVVLRTVAKTYTGSTTVEGLLTVESTSNISTGDLAFNNPLVGGTARNYNLTLGNSAQTVGSFSGLLADPSTHTLTMALATNHDLTINQAIAGTFEGVITGTNAEIILDASSTAALTLTGENTYTGGTTINGGSLLANNTAGSATGTGVVAVNSTGLLGGTGIISGDVEVNSGGTLNPGDGTGTLTVNGAGGVNLNAGSVFAVELGGTTPGTFDQLVVQNTANLAGLLDVSFLGGNIGSNDSIAILTAGTLVGTFANAPTEGSVLSFDGTSFSVSYLGNQVTLSNFQIPEPSSLVLIGLGTVLLAGKRRRRRIA